MLKKLYFVSSFLFAIFCLNNLSFAKRNYSVIIMNRKAASRSLTKRRPVIFPHALHEKRDSCKNCHPRPFAKKKGANDINMQKNAQGQFCGACHNGKRAWSLLYCDRCHSGSPSIDENPLYRQKK